MGAHGIRPWQDDDGADSLADLPIAGYSALTGAFANAQLPGYLDLPVGSAAIAAAEVLAAALGRPSEDLPEELRRWVTEVRPPVTEADIESALAALSRVAAPSDSEIYNLWMMAPDGDAWMASIADLRRRLDSEP